MLLTFIPIEISPDCLYSLLKILNDFSSEKCYEITVLNNADQFKYNTCPFPYHWQYFHYPLCNGDSKNLPPLLIDAHGNNVLIRFLKLRFLLGRVRLCSLVILTFSTMCTISLQSCTHWFWRAFSKQCYFKSVRIKVVNVSSESKIPLLYEKKGIILYTVHRLFTICNCFLV